MARSPGTLERDPDVDLGHRLQRRTVYGQSETLTATVTTPSGDPTPTSTDGTVTFYDGTTPLGSPQTLSGSPATATLTTTALAAGSHTITARYSGDGSFAPSRSGVEPTSMQSVIPASGLAVTPTAWRWMARATSSSPTWATTGWWR